MAENSKIEWTDATWNPITGCSVVSPGCTNCYAMGLAGTRLRHHPSRAGLTRDTKAGPVWTGEVRLNEGWLDQPLRWKRPRRIFVCAHGDLFHESVPDEWIDRVFAVMALAPQHTFHVLTKRAARMRQYFAGIPDCPAEPAARDAMIEGTAQAIHYKRTGEDPSMWLAVHMPLPNLWLGVSVERQQEADQRIPDLLATPAAVRFLSCEPLLGPLDLTRIDDGAAHREVPLEEWGPVDDDDSPPGLWWDALTGKRTIMHGGATGDWSRTDASLDWVIAGGESGPHARPSHPDWFRSLRDQCQAAGVPFFFKQWGEFKDGSDFAADAIAVLADGRVVEPTQQAMKMADKLAPVRGATMMRRVGKKAAGALLDGREWREMPR